MLVIFLLAIVSLLCGKLLGTCVFVATVVVISNYRGSMKVNWEKKLVSFMIESHMFTANRKTAYRHRHRKPKCIITEAINSRQVTLDVIPWIALVFRRRIAAILLPVKRYTNNDIIMYAQLYSNDILWEESSIVRHNEHKNQVLFLLVYPT